jgi:hypothetical protein
VIKKRLWSDRSGKNMEPAVSAHKFNDDLLLNEQDQNLAARKYPTIFHILNHPELRQTFLQHDEQANRAKRNGRIAGFLAIAFGFIALAIAAVEYPVMHHAGDRFVDFLRLILAGFSALCGIIGVLIGSMGVLFARGKREWLHHRLMGERIRQFHFQTLVFRLPEILLSLKDDASKTVFTSNRKLWFEAIMGRLVGKLDAVLVEIIQEENISHYRLYGGRSELKKDRDSKELDPLFDAYRELRILHQIGYANFKLQDDYKIFSAVPWRQAQVFTQTSFVFIVALCVIDIGVLWQAFIPGSIWTAFASDSISVITIWIALAALAVRALEQGLRPEREVERYQQYRSAVRAILDRFDDSESQAEKIQIMEEMERLCFDELRNFLITNERARFVL